jgi:hypothetical protein
VFTGFLLCTVARAYLRTVHLTIPHNDFCVFEIECRMTACHSEEELPNAN